MDQNTARSLAQVLVAMADDELVLGHRDSEWCGFAPILEEDIAFANIALDEIGHANLWYGLAAELLGEDPDTYPDQLVYQRKQADFRSMQLAEFPNGDWAFSMLRQYLFDAVELFRLETLSRSSYDPLAHAAAKIRKEEIYHHRHTQAWVLRLGQGTDESHSRMQSALGRIWPYTGQFFTITPEEEPVPEEIAPDASHWRGLWEENVRTHLETSGISIPSQQPLVIPRQQPSPHRSALVQELQSVARLDPEAEW